MKSITALSILVSLAILAGLTAGSSSATTRCQEDMHCWNWTTMGNHTRGVKINVSACEFRKLVNDGASPGSMPGDHFAMHKARCYVAPGNTNQWHEGVLIAVVASALFFAALGLKFLLTTDS